jgi:hypothetical protein
MLARSSGKPGSAGENQFSAGRSNFDALVKVLLKAGRLDIEGKDLAGKGWLRGQIFGASYAPLPNRFSHRPIMGLRRRRRQLRLSRSFREIHFVQH